MCVPVCSSLSEIAEDRDRHPLRRNCRWPVKLHPVKGSYSFSVNPVQQTDDWNEERSWEKTHTFCSWFNLDCGRRKWYTVNKNDTIRVIIIVPFVCQCVCVRVCVRVCEWVRERSCVWVCVCAWLGVSVLARNKDFSLLHSSYCLQHDWKPATVFLSRGITQWYEHLVTRAGRAGGQTTKRTR